MWAGDVDVGRVPLGLAPTHVIAELEILQKVFPGTGPITGRGGDAATIIINNRSTSITALLLIKEQYISLML